MARRRKVRDVLAEVLTAFVKERFGQDFSVDPMDIHPVRGSWRNGRGADYSPTSWNAFAKDSSFTTRMVAGLDTMSLCAKGVIYVDGDGLLDSVYVQAKPR